MMAGRAAIREVDKSSAVDIKLDYVFKYRLDKRMGVDMTYETETDGKTYWFAGVYGQEGSQYVKCFFAFYMLLYAYSLESEVLSCRETICPSQNGSPDAF